MAEGFVQVATDGTGKQLDNDVVTIPAGTIITDNFGNQTVLAAPAFYYRERVVIADSTNPLAVASVKGGVGPNAGEFGATVNVPMGQAADNVLIALLMDIDANIAALAGNPPLSAALGQTLQSIQLAQVVSGSLPPGPLQASRPAVSDRFGRQIIIPQTLRELMTSFEATITGTGETAISPAPTDTTTVYDLQVIVITNTSATGVYVAIRDQLSTVVAPSSNNAVMYVYAPPTDTRGFSIGGALIPQSNTGQQWTAVLSAAVTDVRIWALYAKNQR